MTRSLILDFDGSVQGLSDADTIPLRDRQESIRFGCGMAALRGLREENAAEPAMG